jgi:GNAT superfamily N-acetyltransferase
MNVLITPLGTADVDSVAALARLVWQQTYPGIISRRADRLHARAALQPAALARRIDDAGSLWWDQARVEGQLAGFSSCLLTAAGREMKLDKLYVDPARQRLGIGARD